MFLGSKESGGEFKTSVCRDKLKLSFFKVKVKR